jgi:hypothetical protein
VEAMNKKVFWDSRGLIVISENEELEEYGKDKSAVDEVIKMFKQ